MPYSDPDYRRFKQSDMWRRLSAKHEICERCHAELATKVRYKVWCRGDDWSICDPGNLESVCVACHRSVSANRSYSRETDANGYPHDPRHPANMRR